MKKMIFLLLLGIAQMAYCATTLKNDLGQSRAYITAYKKDGTTVTLTLLPYQTLEISDDIKEIQAAGHPAYSDSARVTVERGKDYKIQVTPQSGTQIIK